MNFDLLGFVISMLVLLVSLTVHEMAHAKSAELAGDDTARRAGRISINPLDHLDPVGTIMMVISSLSGFGIGWAKPVPVNPAKFRHPRWDTLKVSLWGPLSNLMIALVFGLIIRLFWQYLGEIDRFIIINFVVINIMLALFNLLPITPLDGSNIMSSLLPVDKARRYDIFMMRYGFMILLGLVMAGPMLHFDILGGLLLRPALIILKLFTGIDF